LCKPEQLNVAVRAGGRARPRLALRAAKSLNTRIFRQLFPWNEAFMPTPATRLESPVIARPEFPRPLLALLGVQKDVHLLPRINRDGTPIKLEDHLENPRIHAFTALTRE